MTDIEQLHGDLYNPTNSYENHRTPTIYKNANGQGGMTAWTPTAGKKFRLMGFHLSVTPDAAISGGAAEVIFSLTDQATPIGFSFRAFIPATAVVATPGSIVIASIVIPGNGYLSLAAANNLLVGVTGGVLTTGQFVFNSFGTEE